MQNITSISQQPIRKVLLATDFSAASQAAFQVALDLCATFEADLRILHVFEYGSVSPPEWGGQQLELDSFYKNAELSVDTLIQEARRSGLQCEGKIGSGISDETIIETLKTDGIDLVVLGTRSIHGFERLIFGSTAEAVLRKATCPVLTVGPRTIAQGSGLQAREGVVVFATDFHAITTDALHSAAFFSQKMGLPLHCLNVLPRGVEGGTHTGAIPVIIIEALQHLVGQLDRKYTSPLCVVSYGTEVSAAIVEYARKWNARLIVLGVRRTSLTASHVPAHIAYRVITEAPCPVLTMAFAANILSSRLETTGIEKLSMRPNKQQLPSPVHPPSNRESPTHKRIRSLESSDLCAPDTFRMTP